MAIGTLRNCWTRTLTQTLLHRPLSTSARHLANQKPLTPENITKDLNLNMSGNTASSEVNKTAHEFDKTNLDSLLSRRFFFAPAFEIYGGVAGLYDYGPTGSALQANILDAWRKHYIIEEDMLELDTTIMTLSDVLKTSGHVDK